MQVDDYPTRLRIEPASPHDQIWRTGGGRSARTLLILAVVLIVTLGFVISRCKSGAGTIVFDIEVIGRVEESETGAGVGGAQVLFVENGEGIDDRWLHDQTAIGDADRDVFRRRDSGRGRTDESGAFRFMAFRMYCGSLTGSPESSNIPRVAQCCERCAVVFFHPDFEPLVLPVSSEYWKSSVRGDRKSSKLDLGVVRLQKARR